MAFVRAQQRCADPSNPHGLLLNLADFSASLSSESNTSKPSIWRKPSRTRVMLAALLLQSVLPEAERHIDLAHLDAVLARIADDLRGRVKSHRLRIQQTAAESVGMKTLEP